MKKDKWIASLENSEIFESPLGTPQFSDAYKKFRHLREKASLENSLDDYFSYITSHDKHIESVISVEDAERIKSRQNTPLPPVSDSELTFEIERLRSESESAILKLKKVYLEKERELFQQIPNEADLQILIATRPDILEISHKVSPSPLITPESIYLDSSTTADYNIHRFNYQSYVKRSKFGSSINPNELRSIISEIMIEDESFIKSRKADRYSEIFQNAFEEDIKEKEQIIRLQIDDEYKNDLDIMANKFEEQIQQGIEETKSALNKF